MSPPGRPTGIRASARRQRRLRSGALFPDDSYWHADVSQLPVHPDSDTFIDTMGRVTALHADFGSGLYDGSWIGIPYTVVDGDQPGVDVSFLYADESDPGPYPIPANAPLAGGPKFVEDSNRHVLAVERDSCILYELYKAEPQEDGAWKADSGAVFDLDSNDLRPDTFTSADAAGLPILPGLVHYDEVAAGEIDHAIRFTVEETRDEYVWPARHQAGQPGDGLPPMGLWLRLEADFDTSGYPEELRVILRTMQKHGLILTDNGSSMFISGTPDDRWDNGMLALMREITADNFEAVDVSSFSSTPSPDRSVNETSARCARSASSPLGGKATRTDPPKETRRSRQSGAPGCIGREHRRTLDVPRKPLRWLSPTGSSQ